METQKLELIEKMEAKGMTVAQAAQSMEFDAELLELYLHKDAYPVPQRILDKLAQVVNN
jgi:predicted transposase YdaD